MKDCLLIKTQATLRNALRAGCDTVVEHRLCRRWLLGQPKPYQEGRVVVIPAYEDGNIGFPVSFIWKGKNGCYHVKNCYGKYEFFKDMNDAIKVALAV